MNTFTKNLVDSVAVAALFLSSDVGLAAEPGTSCDLLACLAEHPELGSDNYVPIVYDCDDVAEATQRVLAECGFEPALALGIPWCDGTGHVMVVTTTSEGDGTARLCVVDYGRVREYPWTLGLTPDTENLPPALLRDVEAAYDQETGGPLVVSATISDPRDEPAICSETKDSLDECSSCCLERASLIDDDGRHSAVASSWWTACLRSCNATLQMTPKN